MEKESNHSNVIQSESTKPNHKQTPAVKVIDEQSNHINRQQFELIKKKLRKAEDKRKAAEKRAIDAENLLQQKKSQFIPKAESIPQISIDKPDVFESLEPITEIEVKMAAEFENDLGASESKFNNEINSEEADYFADLYEKPQNNKRSYRILATSALIVSLFGGIIWSYFYFFNNKPFQTNKIVINEEQSTPKDTSYQEFTPPATAPKSNDVFAETETDYAQEKDDNNSSKSDKVKEPEILLTPKAPQNKLRQRKAKPRKRVPYKKIKPVRKKPNKRKDNKKVVSPKTTKPNKKTVTLAELLKDN